MKDYQTLEVQVSSLKKKLEAANKEAELWGGIGQKVRQAIELWVSTNYPQYSLTTDNPTWAYTNEPDESDMPREFLFLRYIWRLIA